MIRKTSQKPRNSTHNKEHLTSKIRMNTSKDLFNNAYRSNSSIICRHNILNSVNQKKLKFAKLKNKNKQNQNSKSPKIPQISQDYLPKMKRKPKKTYLQNPNKDITKESLKSHHLIDSSSNTFLINNNQDVVIKNNKLSLEESSKEHIHQIIEDLKIENRILKKEISILKMKNKLMTKDLNQLSIELKI